MRQTLSASYVSLAMCVLAGCASYIGGARSADPARVHDEPGWITAAHTPVVGQSRPAECGPAALAMVAGRWQVPLALEDATRLVPEPTERGVKLGHLRDAAREIGLLAFAIRGDRSTLVHELREGRPVVVGLLLPHRRGRVRSHYEVVVAIRPETDEVMTIDPAAGWRIRHWRDLDAEWLPAGRAAMVVLGPAHPHRAALGR
jgi:ABC-type bacteriocin/lantibiotic exporter with double-glycine peptidase domain